MAKPYIEALKTELKKSIFYKVNSLFYLSVVIIPPIAIFFLWKSVLSGGGSIGQYNLSMMVTYYIVTQFFVMNTPYSAWIEIGESIKNGNISIWLGKPINHYVLHFSRLIGAWIIQWIFGLCGVMVVFLLLSYYIVLPKEMWRYMLSLLFWLGGVVIGFSYGYILNLLSFWLERSVYLIYFSEGVIALLSGAIVPLDLLPLKKIWLFLPFRFCGYMPAQVFLGNLTLKESMFEFLIMILWICFFVFLSNFTLKRGLKKFEAAGG